MAAPSGDEPPRPPVIEDEAEGGLTPVGAEPTEDEAADVPISPLARTAPPPGAVPTEEEAVGSTYYALVRDLYKDEIAEGKEPAAVVAVWQPRGPDLSPMGILRTIVYVQAAYRRFQMEDMVEMAGIEPTAPPPPVAVAAFFARRMTFPERIDHVGEAMGLACIICGQTSVKLGDLNKAYEEYAKVLPADHAVLEMLLERFGEVQVDAETDLSDRLEKATVPSEARAIIEQVKKDWDAPESGKRPDDGELFAVGDEVTERLRRHAEQMLTAKLEICQTKADIDKLARDVEVELQGGHTVLRTRVRNARENHRFRTETEVHSIYGWPPVGPISNLASGCRFYTVELGAGHPSIMDFVAATKRLKRRREAHCEKELLPFDEGLHALRMKIGTNPPPPKLLREGYLAQFREDHALAAEKVEDWWRDFRVESDSFLVIAERMLGKKRFLGRCEEELEERLEELRDLPAGPEGLTSIQFEERLCAAVRSLQLLEAMEKYGSEKVDDFRKQLPQGDVERARPLVDILADEEPESDDDWHRPLGFRDVDAELAPKDPTPPPTEPDDEQEDAEERKADISICMKLHGVSMEDLSKVKSEILLMEMLTDVIAKECGVPRDWVSGIKLKPPEGAPASDPAALAAEGGGHDQTAYPDLTMKAPGIEPDLTMQAPGFEEESPSADWGPAEDAAEDAGEDSN
mmetsp:Transcript_66746/g.144010  ORF Transcript_66746/g.144010 Transcript_66746/m.144010 type:complete len:689 (-) Transcript_66746:93-2159(-)